MDCQLSPSRAHRSFLPGHASHSLTAVCMYYVHSMYCSAKIRASRSCRPPQMQNMEGGVGAAPLTGKKPHPIPCHLTRDSQPVRGQLQRAVRCSSMRDLPHTFEGYVVRPGPTYLPSAQVTPPSWWLWWKTHTRARRQPQCMQPPRLIFHFVFLPKVQPASCPCPACFSIFGPTHAENRILVEIPRRPSVGNHEHLWFAGCQCCLRRGASKNTCRPSTVRPTLHTGRQWGLAPEKAFDAGR